MFLLWVGTCRCKSGVGSDVDTCCEWLCLVMFDARAGNRFLFVCLLVLFCLVLLFIFVFCSCCVVCFGLFGGVVFLFGVVVGSCDEELR